MNLSALPPTLPDFSDVRAAVTRLAGVAHRTPVLTSRTANALTGAQLFFKCENLQRGGAFKFRGAYNAIAALPAAQRAAGVLAFSSGNHAQAIAYSASLLSVKATILMPADAPASKIEATRGYGGEVLLFDRYKEDREALAARLAAERGLTLIPPYDHRDVIAGQGTAAVELFEQTGPLDLLLVCMGGGGLTSGCALAAASLSPGCAVWGVEPEAGNDGQQSLRAGRIVHIDVPRTIADGAQTQHLGALTFDIIRQHVAGIATVSDEALRDAMRFVAARMKLVIEPTGALAVAAALSAAVPVKGLKVGVIISGGNVDLARFSALVN
jgi:threonine dehydratase